MGTSPSPDRTRMRWSVVLVCILLLAVVAEGKKKKPSKGKKPGKKPSKPGVKGECDVGSPKLTPQNTKKYTGTGKCACWWDITRNDCACCKKGVGAMQCGFPMHKKKANVGKFGQYWQCECNKGYTGNGIQCMDGDGNLSAQPGQQVEVTLTMTAGLYEDAPVENEFSHGDAMESLLAEMETAGGACAGDDCEASFEVTEV